MTKIGVNLDNILDERLVLLEAIYNPNSEDSRSVKGYVKIKIWRETVSFNWYFSHRIDSMGQDQFPTNMIPDSDDALGFALARAIEHIQNYRVDGQTMFVVTKGSWRYVNVDIERVKTLIKDVEIIRSRIGMYLVSPAEVEIFFRGMETAYRTFGLLLDQDAKGKAFEAVGFDHKSLMSLDKSEWTWDDVDKVFQAYLLAWKYTYGLESFK